MGKMTFTVLLGLGIPVSSILVTFFVWYQQMVATGGEVSVVISGGSLLACGVLVWKQSAFQQRVESKLNNIDEKLGNFLTRDQVDLRLSNERAVSDGKYVSKEHCEHEHVKITRNLDEMAKSMRSGK